MKKLWSLLLIVMSVVVAFGAEEEKDKGLVFREPFTLKLHVDKGHYYEQEFGKVPYVDGGDVYLFKGDDFGLDLEVRDGEIKGLKYEKDPKKADVTLKFTQGIEPAGEGMMLVIRNNTKYTLEFDALMTKPDAQQIYETTILPVPPGLSGYESWPHPIVQMMLRNIRIGAPAAK